MPPEHWKNEPEEHDFPSALSYLSLVCEEGLAEKTVERLRGATIATYEAKDLLRASRLPLLKKSNLHVVSDLAKIREGGKLSPVLLVRGSVLDGVPLTIADGYHRICTSYHLNENAKIPCRIVDWL